MAIDEVERSNIFMNVVLDDLTVIELSVAMLEIYYKQHMDKEAKRYFENIKNHCNNIVKTIKDRKTYSLTPGMLDLINTNQSLFDLFFI